MQKSGGNHGLQKQKSSQNLRSQYQWKVPYYSVIIIIIASLFFLYREMVPI
jgi:hypothetical protein